MSETVQSLFERLRSGDEAALTDLTPTLYGELHRIAARHMASERPSHTWQPTALVHEAYLKIFSGADREFADKVHFLAVASRVMRQLLVDYARARATEKRSSALPPDDGRVRTTSLEVQTGDGLEPLDFIELDDALSDLAAEQEELARLIEMRYFGGMTAEETAEALKVSVHVVRHDLRYAQAWLRRRMSR